MSKSGRIRWLWAGWCRSAIAKESDIGTEHIFFVSVEADDEMQESEMSRGLSDEEKQQKPSEVMSSLEKGLGAIANLFNDGVSSYVLLDIDLTSK